MKLVSLTDHPDATLIGASRNRLAHRDRWVTARTEKARQEILSSQRRGRTADDYMIESVAFAALQAVTLDGLIDKASVALVDWREADSPDRYKRLDAALCSCLEQALTTLQAMTEPPAIRRFET